MNELSKTILNECREEVARGEEWGKANYEETMIDTARNQPEKLEAIMFVIASKASELALDRISEFYEWVQSKSGRSFFKGFGYWGNNEEGYISTEKLYNIWREGK